MDAVAPPAFSDNTIWMLHGGARAPVAGPGDAAVVHFAALRGWKNPFR
jgi:hypothetical protein